MSNKTSKSTKSTTSAASQPAKATRKARAPRSTKTVVVDVTNAIIEHATKQVTDDLCAQEDIVNAVVEVLPVVGCVVLSDDCSYTGEIAEVGVETPDMVKVQWHQILPDGEVLNSSWEIGKTLKVITEPVAGLWWPAPKPMSDKPLIMDMSSAENTAIKAIGDFHSQVDAVKTVLPLDGPVDEEAIGNVTDLPAMVVRTCLSHLKKEGFLRYDLKTDKFFVLSAEELERLKTSPKNLDTGKKLPKPKVDQPKKQPKAKPAPSLCACGCGQMCKTGTSYFMMGHDARAKGILIRVMSGEIKNFTPTDRLAEYCAAHPEWWDRFSSVFTSGGNPMAETVEGMDKMLDIVEARENGESE